MALGEGKIYVSLDVAAPGNDITQYSTTTNGTWAAGSGASSGFTSTFTFPLASTSASCHWNEWPSTTTPCDEEHVLDGKSCEVTPEGRFSGECRECGITLILTRVPGGVDYLMVRDLMRYLMGGGDVEDVAGEILELQTALREQQRAVEEGLELLEIAKQKLAQQAVAV